MIQLSENEAKVYTLLKKNLTQDQIHKLTGKNRKMIIKYLNALQSKHLATVTYNGRFPIFTPIEAEYELINQKKAVAQ